MKKVDQHVHTTISHDGESNMEGYIIMGKQLGYDELTFTEHYDDYTGVETKIKELNVDFYESQYKKFKNDRLVKTNFGIEIGLRPESVDKIKDMVSKHNFDFIIGSSHITCGKDMAMDKSFFTGLSRKEAYLKYFNEVLENIKLYDNEFDVYGHLDYVVRYGGYYDKSISYREFSEILNKILINLIMKEKGIEINTSGLRYGLGSTHPNQEILNRYKELGGKIVTIGSDAHKISDVGSNFNVAYKMLEKAGFDEIAVFHNREPEFVKIKSLK